VEYGQDIYNSGRHLLALVDDILDISKIEEHNVQLNETVLNLPGIAGETVRLLKPGGDKLRILLTLGIAAGLPRLRTDRKSFQQILINLLSNALKFLPLTATGSTWTCTWMTVRI
jgi:signal transduction histidine kinase